MVTNILLKVIEYGIIYGVKWILRSDSMSIGNRLARAMIEGVAKSQGNTTSVDMFKDALTVLE